MITRLFQISIKMFARTLHINFFFFQLNFQDFFILLLIWFFETKEKVLELLQVSLSATLFVQILLYTFFCEVEQEET